MKDSIYKALVSKTPGPGSYDCDKPKQNKTNGGNILFAKEERKLGSDLTNTELGPGSYNPIIEKQGKGCRILGRCT
jgi:hypothetical protein